MSFYFIRFRGQETIEEHRGCIEHFVERFFFCYQEPYNLARTTRNDSCAGGIAILFVIRNYII